MQRLRLLGRLALAASIAAALVACAGGAPAGGSATAPGAVPPPAEGAAVVSDALGPVVISPGAVNGLDDQYHPGDGDMGAGGHGQVIDTIHCDKSMVTNKYHVHAFLGVVNKGRLIALPDTIGMFNPGPEVGGYTNTATCFYNIHTHDASGMIHLELDRVLPFSAVVYHLKNVLDIWGVPYSASSFGPFSGPMHVFVGNVPLKTTTVTSYQPYSGALQDIPLRSHEAIWVEIGTPYYTASQLPSVRFYTEY